MKKVELAKGIYSSALGFGCAPILGAVDAKNAKRAIETALDCGINHFDLARSYGYGEAEHFVGKILKPHRNDMVIATKFGIRANWKAELLRPLKPIVRTTLNTIKGNKQNMTSAPKNAGANYADRFFNRVPLTGSEMQKSVEKSLRALQTDYIDFLFIHEPIQTINQIDDLIQRADLLKQEGKIRAFGLAFMRTQQSLHTGYLDRFDILQFDMSPGAEGYCETQTERGNKPNVIFSPLRGGTPSMSANDKLRKLSTEFPNSVILCSMFNQKHIMDNASLF